MTIPEHEGDRRPTTTFTAGHRPGRARMGSILVAVALVVGGCGGGDESEDPTPIDDPPADTGAGDGDQKGTAMSVAEAMDQAPGTEVTVEGYLIQDGDVVTMSEFLAESYPPQPGGRWVEVDGIDLSPLSSISVEGPIRWFDRTVTITAVVGDGRLVDAALDG